MLNNLSYTNKYRNISALFFWGGGGGARKQSDKMFNLFVSQG